MNTIGFQYSLYTKGDYISAANNLCINNIPVINSTSLGPNIINSNLTSLGTILDLKAKSSNINELTINNTINTPNIVISGTQNTIPVNITSGINTNISDNYKYFNNDPLINKSETISLKATNSIWTQGAFIISSDERIKTNIKKADTTTALQNILSLPLMTFNYIDTKENGSDTFVGMIAQEVHKIIPAATTITKGIIPSIYKLASYIQVNDENILLHVELNNVELKIGDKLELIIENIGKLLVNIINYTNTTILVNKWEHFNITDSVFIYGPEINDFYTIDEAYLGILCMGGIQELNNYINNINSDISNVSSIMTNIKKEINISVDEMTKIKTHHNILTDAVNRTNDQFFNITTDFANQIKEVTNKFFSITTEISNQINTNTSTVSVLKNYNTLLSNVVNNTHIQISKQVADMAQQLNANTTDMSLLKTYNTLLSNLVNKTNENIKSTVSELTTQINATTSDISVLKTYNTLLSNLLNKTNEYIKKTISEFTEQINSNTTEISILKSYNTLISNLINKTNINTNVFITDISNKINTINSELLFLQNKYDQLSLSLYLRYSDIPKIISYWNNIENNYISINNYDTNIAKYYYLSWADNIPKDNDTNLSNCWNNNLFTVPINGIYNINISLQTSTHVYLFISKGLLTHPNIINNLTDYNTLVVSVKSSIIDNTCVATINNNIKLSTGEYLIFGIYCTENGNIIGNSDIIAPNSYLSITLL